MAEKINKDLSLKEMAKALVKEYKTQARGDIWGGRSFEAVIRQDVRGLLGRRDHRSFRI